MKDSLSLYLPRLCTGNKIAEAMQNFAKADELLNEDAAGQMYHILEL